MMRAAVVALLLVSASARADKVRTDAARKAVTAWLKVMHADATKQSAVPFRAVSVGDVGSDRCDVTAKTADQLAAALACARHVPGAPTYAVYTAKSASQLFGDLEPYKEEIAALAKTHTLMIGVDEGEDIVNVTVFAVEMGSDKVVRVSAAFGNSFTH